MSLALLLLGAALASPVGEPLVDPAVGRIQLRATADGEVIAVRDIQCGSDACDGAWEGGGVGLEGQLVLLRGLGVYGGLSQVSGNLPEAQYLGDGTAWRFGLRGALPLGRTSLSLAAAARVEVARTEGATLESGDRQRADSRTAAASVVLASGSPRDGITTWIGADIPVWWLHEVLPLGTGVEAAPVSLWLLPTTPAALVAGVSATSDPLTPMWSQPVRALTGAELRLGGARAIAAWCGISF